MSNGVITIINGIFELAYRVVSPIALMILVTGASLAWLALLELDELKRWPNSKPRIGVGL